MDYCFSHAILKTMLLSGTAKVVSILENSPLSSIIP